MQLDTSLKKNSLLETDPAHIRIRKRILDAGYRFHANDNIADFIEEGELDSLRAELEQKLEDVLSTLIIDTRNDHNTHGTAKRIAKMFLHEIFRGRYEHAPDITTFPNASELDELLIVGPINIRSTCSHHFCPITGKLWIGVMPSKSSSLSGLSKYSRLSEWIMNRPQIQEEAISMLADELENRLAPDGLGIVIEASHYCTSWRGIKEEGMLMRNSIMRGVFLENSTLRQEFLSLIRS